MLLELRGRRALDRPVAAIVDPRRNLVDERAVGAWRRTRPSARRHGRARRRSPRRPRRASRPAPSIGGAGGDGRAAQDAVRHARCAVSGKARSRRPPRARSGLNSASKSIAGFGHRRRRRRSLPTPRAHRRGDRDPGLALAVIAERRLLSTSGSRARRRAASMSSSAVDFPPRRDARAACLRGSASRPRGPARFPGCGCRGEACRRARRAARPAILEFVGDDVALRRRSARSAASSSKAARVKRAATSAAQGCRAGRRYGSDSRAGPPPAPSSGRAGRRR